MTDASDRGAAMTRVYGDKGGVYANLPHGSGVGKKVNVWRNVGLGHHECICVASDKFNAMTIIYGLRCCFGLNQCPNWSRDDV